MPSGFKVTVISRTSFVFDRQRIVVVGEDSLTLACAIQMLRRDGHCVTHVADAHSASVDFALRDCHLCITGSSISGVARAGLIDELRERLPAVAILCLTDVTCAPSGPKTRSHAGVTTLGEPFTAEELRAAVRPLLPQLRMGSILAQEAERAALHRRSVAAAGE